jgi:hypothetical protein
MKPLTVEYIQKHSKQHPISAIDNRSGARMFQKKIGDYTLSIVGGDTGLYGDFENTFEVALIDDEAKEFVTGKFCKRGDEVLPYADIDEINEIYFNIPRTS